MSAPEPSLAAPPVAAAAVESLLAAGGLLLDESGRLALVHRPQYGDTALPKGKVKLGESPMDAALREVREETGFDAEPGAFAGAVSYSTGGRPKIVLFWRMRAKGRAGDPASGEVDRVDWVTPEEAPARLDHHEERELVEHVLVGGRRKAPMNMGPRLRFSRRVRLAAHLRALRPELDATIRMWQEANGGAIPAWIPACRHLLALAEGEQAAGRVEEAWRCLSALHRLETAAYSQDRLESEAASLRQEAKEKLLSWRGAAIQDLLKKEVWDGLQGRERRERLARSLLIRDENTANMYHKAALLREQLAVLAAVLFVLVGLLLWTALAHPLPLSGTLASSGWLLWYTALFGALAGCLSGAWSLTRNASEARIPERLMNWPATFARPLLGAAAGVAAYVLLGPSLESSAAGVLSAAFAAGFSERLILSAVASKAPEK